MNPTKSPPGLAGRDFESIGPLRRSFAASRSALPQPFDLMGKLTEGP